MIPKENYIGFRTDLEDYFKWMTGVSKSKKSFTPFVFEKKKKMLTCWHWRDLFDLIDDHDNTVIMQVWPGHFKCDCFIFTLEELQDYLYINNEIEL